MSLSWPTKEQIRATIIALYKAERPNADYTKYSDLWLHSRIWSVLTHRLHKTTGQALNAVFPTTSFGNYLDSWLSWLGLPDGQGGFGRILPHISAAEDGLRCIGINVAINAWTGQQLTDSAGHTYVCTSAHPAIVGLGQLDLDVESVTTGFTVNLETGTVLVWVAPPAGSTGNATTIKDLVGGTDLEEDSAGRMRLLGRLRNSPASGNTAGWVATVEAVLAGNLKAWIWPQRQNQPYGYGLTDYCATYLNETGTDRHIAAADDIYTDISNACDTAMPALIYRNSRQLTLTSVPTLVEITVTLGSDATNDQKCDWDAEGNQTTVAANDAGGPEIDCVANVCIGGVTDGIEVGHKVVINGIEGTVTAVDIGGDASKFEVSDWPDGWGSAINSLVGFNVASGGGFIGWKTEYDNAVAGAGLVEAARAYMDTRGPNVSHNAAQSQIPGWDSSVRIQQLESLCFVVGGGVIVDVSVTRPAGDISHVSQDGATALIYDVSEITIWQVYA